MTCPAHDRRRARKRLFAGAALAFAASLAIAGALLWLLAAPWAALLSVLVGLGVAGVALHRPGGVPVLVYHSVSPDAAWLPWAGNTSVRPETLRRHLETLRRGGWTVISTKALVARRRRGAPVEGRAAVLHFDDGYLDNLLFAVPILRQFDAPATFFVSTDFIDQSDVLRADAACRGASAWQGYMNAAELRALDADPLFDVEAHGTDHARVPVSDRIVDRLSEANWRRHAPLGWARDPRNKSRWFDAEGPPPPLRLGEPVRENDSALTGRWWRDGAEEDEADHEDRVARALTRARVELGRILGRSPEVLAWPFDRCGPVSVDVARRVGFAVVTGGLGQNRPGEDPAMLSRVHVQDRAFGGGPLWLEGLALRARVNAASGRLAWHLLVALAARLRRFGRPGHEAAT